MTTDPTVDEGLVDLSPPPPEPLPSPLPSHVNLDELQRQLIERFGYDVDLRLYIRLVTDPTTWTIPDIIRELDVTRAAVNKWTRRTRDEGPDGPVGMPEPYNYHGQSPVWQAGVVRRWAIEKGKMLADGTPVKQKGTTRPPRRRRTTPTE